MRLYPRAWVPLSDWGAMLAQQGRMQEAVAKWRAAAELNPAASYPYNAWGIALYQLRNYKDAAEKFRKALELSPGDTGIRENLARTLKILE